MVQVVVEDEWILCDPEDTTGVQQRGNSRTGGKRERAAKGAPSWPASPSVLKKTHWAASYEAGQEGEDTA